MSEREPAQTLALRALTWMMEQPEEFSAFQAASGIGPQDFARMLGAESFLVSVLDFVLEADARVIAFCQHEGLAYDAPMQARVRLAGPAGAHWT